MGSRGVCKMEVVVVEVLLHEGLLYFAIDLIDDGHQIVLKLDLQLLVVATALIRSAPLEDLRKAEENLAPATRRLA